MDTIVVPYPIFDDLHAYLRCIFPDKPSPYITLFNNWLWMHPHWSVDSTPSHIIIHNDLGACYITPPSHAVKPPLL
jgi:hypothetical protein